MARIGSVHIAALYVKNISTQEMSESHKLYRKSPIRLCNRGTTLEKSSVDLVNTKSVGALNVSGRS
jgi:hypothetical protein